MQLPVGDYDQLQSKLSLLSRLVDEVHGQLDCVVAERRKIEDAKQMMDRRMADRVAEAEAAAVSMKGDKCGVR